MPARKARAWRMRFHRLRSSTLTPYRWATLHRVSPAATWWTLGRGPVKAGAAGMAEDGVAGEAVELIAGEGEAADWPTGAGADGIEGWAVALLMRASGAGSGRRLAEALATDRPGSP
jgi:hypothetical protein